MKKSVIILIVSLSIAALLIGVGIAMLFINLNKEKTPISAERFTSSMTQKGYVVQSSKQQFAAYDYIKKSYIAAPQDLSYKIEFYELKNEEYANAFYENNKSIFENSKGGVVTSSLNLNGKNWSKYALSADGKYKVVSRVGNTAIYLNVDNDYKDIANKLLDEFGY
jgi:hypothetical protein